MKIAVISFSRQGAETAAEIKEAMLNQGHEAESYGMRAGTAPALPVTSSLSQWTKAAFAEQDAVVFVGATGIAVRAIAPYVKSKTTDPAIVGVDELGRYAISLLSGHLGGANTLTGDIAAAIGAEPVITTATDINGKLAVDQWAKENNCEISSMIQAKRVAAALLDGQPVGFFSEFPIEGVLPQGLKPLKLSDSRLIKAPKSVAAGGQKQGAVNLYIGMRAETPEFAEEETLKLVPRVLSLGIGCRRGTSFKRLEDFCGRFLARENLCWEAVERIATIDLKKDEEGLIELARHHGVPLITYSSEELQGVEGDFTPSSFVKSVTGVDNVCERAAKAGDRRELYIRKTAENGMTAALAYTPFQVRF